MSDPRIVFLGSLNDDRKGLDILLEAYKADPSLRRFRLEVFGFGARREHYERLAARYGVPATFRGYAETEDIAASLSGAAALVTPSREESFGVGYAQSACLGVPAVGFAPAIREIGGILGMPIGVPFDASRQDAKELAGAVGRAVSEGLSGMEGRRVLSETARRYFNVDRYGEAYASEYRGLLTSGEDRA
jgi:glycosyltransferase involved in cell wall biosynthesis